MEWCTVFPLKVARFQSENERPSGRKVSKLLTNAIGKRVIFPMKFPFFPSDTERACVIFTQRRRAVSQSASAPSTSLRTFFEGSVA
jgi:hypothetical protein